jgi:hypothetical protein
MSNNLTQGWALPGGGEIHLQINATAPFPQQVWNEDLPKLIEAIEELRLHLGGDM